MPISRDQLFEILNSLPSDTQPNEDNVLGLSLTRSAVPTDALAELAQVATVTFKSTPHNFQSSPFSLVLDVLGVVTLDYNFFGMTPLSNPAEPVVDIIAITGLAGHGFGSWKSRTAHTMWLRDLLPVHVTNARILTYGYDSTLFGNESHASIHEFSQLFLQALATIRTSEKEQSRPIIFIAHSLGGLVIKYVLCDHPSVLASCHALLLFGVPHHGLNVVALKSMVRGQPNAKLLEDLDERSSFLSLLDRFWKSHRTVGIKIISIYEGKPTATVQETPEGWKRTGPKVLMVNQYSATAASVDSGDSFCIDRNHSDIVKFDNEVCQYYKIIKRGIGDLVKDVQDGPWVKLKKDERGEVLRWLLTVEFEDHHAFNSNRRQQGSGTWLLENKMWNKWATGNESSVLWLRGDAGSGKTMLASFVIDTLKTEAKSDDHILAYFYCDYKEPKRQEPIPILNTIVKQFCLKQPAREGKIPKIVLEEYEKRADQGHSSGTLNMNECQDLLLALSNHYLKTTIIIDALDECNHNTRCGLFNALKFIVSMSRSIVKIFITSRYHDDIERAFRETIHYYLCADDNQKDIERFIEEEVNRRCDPQRLGDTDLPLLSGKIVQTELKAEIIFALKSRSCGMFLWAQLQILALCDERTESGVRKALRELPNTLSETYSRMLYPDNHAQSGWNQLHRHRLLKFLMCIETKWSEELILQALAIQCGEDTVDEEILCFERSDVLTICQNFVVYNDKLNCVEFAHFSVKEYLLKEEGLSEVSCHNMMAAACLTALLFHSRSEKMKDIVHYATINWSIHIKRAGPLSEDVSTQLKQFLTGCAPYKDWLHGIGSHDINVKGPRGQVLSPFWVACYYELIAIARDILQEGVDVNTVNEAGETALCSAVKRGVAATAQLLLACNTVNVNEADSNGQTLLFRAVEQRKPKLVRLFLECDRVDVNQVDKGGRTPLLRTVEYPKTIGFRDIILSQSRSKLLKSRTKSILQLLLACGKVDVNQADSNGRTLFFRAVEERNTELVGLLLECDRVDVNQVDKGGRTPLLMIVEYPKTIGFRDIMLSQFRSKLLHSRTKSIVQLLLACGKVDVNQADSNGQTPLLRAVEERNTELVGLLLECDRVDVNQGDKWDQTPLLMAVKCPIDRQYATQLGSILLKSRTKSIVELLLACGKVDVNQADSNGRTPLLRAVEECDTKLVGLLLECERIDVNQVGGGGETPLALAISGVGRGLTHLLLEQGGVGSSGGDSMALRSPVSLEGRRRIIERLERYNTEIIKVLLAFEQIGVSCTDEQGRGLLLIATKALLNIRKQEVIQRAFQRLCPDCLRLSMQSRERYETQICVDRMPPDPSEILEDPIVIDVQHRTIDAYWEVIDLLLQPPTINPNSKDPDGETSLVHASMDSLGVNLMRVLLHDKRVHVTCPDILDRTPLSYAALSGNVEAVKLLLPSESIDVSIADNSGRTPLQYSEIGVGGTSQLIHRRNSVDPGDSDYTLPSDIKPEIRLRLIELLKSSAEDKVFRGIAQEIRHLI
ncbi:ankyrin repeat-containing domain protein [Morchella snyderi]|nr:ankyrin repeat-containing domain protein [Morchella snyderi]